MSDNVISIFKYMLRDMGQCPECRGYIVQLNLDDLIPKNLGDQQKEQSTTTLPVETGDASNWHCLECGHRF